MSDIFNKLKAQLEMQSWPSVYMFLFISPNEAETLAKVTSMFDDSAELVLKESKNGRFVSVRVKELMMDVDSIIAKYEKVAKVKGVIAM